MDNIGNRYMLDQPLKRMTNGLLLRGMDLTCKRDVLLYTFQETDESAHQEALRWLRKASQMSDEHFMHILDAGSEDGTLFAVLQAVTGSPMSDRLRDLEITGHKALTYVHELAKGIRETRRKRLLECSVDAENLWIEDNGRLRIMNFWSEGKNGRRGVPGLALLLYQLGAKTDIPTSSISAYSFELNRLFADLSDVTRERAIALACKAYEGICTLADFQQELEVLLDFGGDRKEPLLTSALPEVYDIMASRGRERKAVIRESHAFVEPKTGERKAEDRTADGRKPGKPQARISAASDRKMAELSELFRKSFQLRKWHLFASVGFCVLVLLLWLSLRPHSDHVNGSKPQIIPTPESTAVSVYRTEPPSASASAMPARTEAPTAKPLDAEVQPADDGAVQAKAGVVPDLVAHTREDAEKMAIASGLRYQFLLESNVADKGVVFKQDLTPGTAAKNGDRITFWVSKGK
ncbi:PASTA domain-containing protein [Paenibacillus alginolyticus]|uniref:PASTA domain-containing protein n=1 Tax=Paenibacillus alginolyticus TaxID=59839 RepID=UPI0003FB96A1|nr:PASTA domain-containing protein [Paenibacillus alginolyticus]MCY9670735.1 PASTA domain-containing protein [Paenibacillus alginolyticus]